MYRGLTKTEVEEKISQGLVNKSDQHMTKSYEDIIRSNTLTYFNIVNAVLFAIVLTITCINLLISNRNSANV